MRNCEQALHECAARPGQYKIAKDAKYTFQPGDQVTDDRLRRYVAPENEFAKCAYPYSVTGKNLCRSSRRQTLVTVTRNPFRKDARWLLSAFRIMGVGD